MEIKKINNDYFYGENKLECKFYDENHEYWLGYNENSEFIKVKQLVSVTTLLKKHKLSADYSKVNESILQAKAERGNIIHEELEIYVKTGEYGFTEELQQFTRACESEEIVPQKSEFIVYNDLVAGCVDTSGTIKGFSYIGDYKTTAVYHEQAVAWQLSLYEYLSGENFDKLICFWFNNGLSIKEVERIDREKIEDLLEKERNGDLTNKNELVLQGDINKELAVIQKALKEIDEQKTELEIQEKAIKEVILKNMQENGIKTIENDFFRITYVAEITRETIDTAKLKVEMPEIADKYKKVTVSAPSLRIKLKEEL